MIAGEIKKYINISSKLKNTLELTNRSANQSSLSSAQKNTMLSIIATMICYKIAAENWGRGGRPSFTMLTQSYTLTPITGAPFVARKTLLHFPFTVYCYRFVSLRKPFNNNAPLGSSDTFKCRKAVICLIRLLSRLKVSLCRNSVELATFRFDGGNSRGVDAFYRWVPVTLGFHTSMAA